MCGAGKACCRYGFAQDPVECKTASTSWLTNHHECVEVPGATAQATVSTTNPITPPADCWLKCNKTSGYCDWCGKGKACCRSGWSGPKECTGAATLAYHSCVTGFTSPVAPICVGILCPNTTTAKTSGSSTTTKSSNTTTNSTTAKVGIISELVKINETNGTACIVETLKNGTNITKCEPLVVADGTPSWVWLLLCLLLLCCCLVPLILWLLGCFADKKTRSSRRKRASKTMDDDKDSYTSNTTERELAPLMQDREITEGQYSSQEARRGLFESMDRNHDGIVMRSEFQAGMMSHQQGGMQTSVSPQPLMSGAPPTFTAPSGYPMQMQASQQSGYRMPGGMSMQAVPGAMPVAMQSISAVPQMGSAQYVQPPMGSVQFGQVPVGSVQYMPQSIGSVPSPGYSMQGHR